MGGNTGKKLYDIVQDRLGKQIDENNNKLYNEDMKDTNATVYRHGRSSADSPWS